MKEASGQLVSKVHRHTFVKIYPLSSLGNICVLVTALCNAIVIFIIICNIIIIIIYSSFNTPHPIPNTHTHTHTHTHTFHGRSAHRGRGPVPSKNLIITSNKD